MCVCLANSKQVRQIALMQVHCHVYILCQLQLSTLKGKTCYCVFLTNNNTLQHNSINVQQTDKLTFPSQIISEPSVGIVILIYLFGVCCLLLIQKQNQLPCLSSSAAQRKTERKSMQVILCIVCAVLAVFFLQSDCVCVCVCVDALQFLFGLL